MNTKDWTSNPNAAAQYEHLVTKTNRREARDVALGLLSCNPPHDFEQAIKAAIKEIDDEIFGLQVDLAGHSTE